MTTPVHKLRPATLADLEALPENVLGEIIEGVLYTFPRPRPIHADVESSIVLDLKGPFQRGRGGPGGWWILVEPGITLPGSPEVVPDLAAWKKEHLPTLPAERSIDVVPDWVCEILSPSTRSHDLRVKRPFYARVGVPYLWFIDLDARTLMVSQLLSGRWTELAIHGAGDVVRAEPFADIEIDLGQWWPTPSGAEERDRPPKSQPTGGGRRRKRPPSS